MAFPSPSKILNVLGGLSQLGGLWALSKVDVAGVRAAAASDTVRSTTSVERFDAEMAGREYEPSTQELEAARLAEEAGAQTQRWFRVGLALVVAGTVLQLAGSIVSD